MHAGSEGARPLIPRLRLVRHASAVEHAIDDQLTQHDQLLQHQQRTALCRLYDSAYFAGHVVRRSQRFTGFEEQGFLVHRWVDEKDPARLTIGNRSLQGLRIEIKVDGASGGVFYALRLQSGVVRDRIGFWRVWRYFEPG